jgi:PhnB protein
MAPVVSRSNALSPYLTVRDAPAAIKFYRAAFGAVEQFRLTDAEGRVGHAELAVEGSTFMLSDEWPDFGALSPATIGGWPVKLHLYVADCDAVVARAVAAGATLLRPVADQFYGDRSGMVVDPYGHTWFVATPKEEVAPAEMQRRWNAALQPAAAGAA